MTMRASHYSRSPGPWHPTLATQSDAQGLGRGGGAWQKRGASGLDGQCQEAMQQLLRPVHYPAIVPWMRAVGSQEKREMVRLAKFASGADSADDPTHRSLAAPRVLVEARSSRSFPVSDDGVHGRSRSLGASGDRMITNAKGRPMLANTVNISGDRLQADLNRNRHGADQKDEALHRKRQFFSEYARVPSTNSVADFFKLDNSPILKDGSMAMLTENARRGLQRWQVRGPERNPEVSAAVMRSLRSLHSAVAALPKYAEHSHYADLSGQPVTDSLHDYATVVPKGHRILRPKPVLDRSLKYSSSAPTLPGRLVTRSEAEAVTRPGGFIVKLMDYEPMQFLKNRQRNKSSKIPMQGGTADWQTAAQTIGQQPA